VTGAERRADILAAALVCFARTGYHGTTMAEVAEVAEAAEVSKGTPYIYFASKEALFVALQDEWNCGLSDRIGTEAGDLSDEERSSPRRVLQAVARAVGVRVVEHADVCRVSIEARMLAAFQPQIPAAVEASEERSREQLRGLIEGGDRRRRVAGRHGSQSGGRAVHRWSLRVDGEVAPETRLVFVGGSHRVACR
jgi:AcrR family transcriptional regulator